MAGRGPGGVSPGWGITAARRLLAVIYRILYAPMGSPNRGRNPVGPRCSGACQSAGGGEAEQQITSA